MSNLLVSIGAQSKVFVGCSDTGIGGTRCGVVSGTMNIRSDTHDVTDTEATTTTTSLGNGALITGRMRIVGLYEGDISIQGLYAADLNPHQSPFFIDVGNRLNIRVNVHSLAGAGYIFIGTLIDDVSISACNPGQPNTWNFHGYSGIIAFPATTG